jgi:hypothetical protein
MGLLGLVFLEGVEEERGRLLDHILAHEDIDDLCAASADCIAKHLSEHDARARCQ